MLEDKKNEGMKNKDNVSDYLESTTPKKNRRSRKWMFWTGLMVGATTLISYISYQDKVNESVQRMIGGNAQVDSSVIRRVEDLTERLEALQDTLKEVRTEANSVDIYRKEAASKANEARNANAGLNRIQSEKERIEKEKERLEQKLGEAYSDFEREYSIQLRVEEEKTYSNTLVDIAQGYTDNPDTQKARREKWEIFESRYPGLLGVLKKKGMEKNDLREIAVTESGRRVSYEATDKNGKKVSGKDYTFPDAYVKGRQK